MISKPDILTTQRSIGLALLTWTLLAALSLFWNIRAEQDKMISLAKTDAQASFKKDVALRRWATLHGGVYVPVTESTRPNPYLADIPERDITTPSGRPLTLMNPAYMMREIYELTIRDFAIYGHLTSLTPLRPANAPDEWEKSALIAFEKGEQEVFATANINNEKHLRYMHVLGVEASCLQCHAKQGYKVGDIRGGISVSVPLSQYKEATDADIAKLTIYHVVLWFLVLALLFIFYKMKVKLSTEQEIVRSQLSHASKLASIGTLAAGVVHEINAPLSIVKGLTNHLQEELKKNKGMPEQLTMLHKQEVALVRIQQIVNGLRDFSRPDQETPTIVNIYKMIRDTISLVTHIFASDGITLQTTYGTSSPEIKAVSGKLEQVLMNLLVNARDAIKQAARPGIIKIATDETKNAIKISVSDNGTGIESSELEKIFDPFYTTKEAGRGSGLGLSISHSIVMAMGGKIAVQSSKNIGSTFTIDLPK